MDNCIYMHANLLQSCLTLCHHVDCTPPGSTVHGILQARTVEWAEWPPPGNLPNPTTEPHLLSLWHWFFTSHATWEAPHSCIYILQIKIGILTRPHTWRMFLLWYSFLRLIVVLSISCLQYFIGEDVKQFFNGLHELCILCQRTLFICSQFWVKGQQSFGNKRIK